ncbi:MAG TPA: glycosyltransferase family 9 protein, partial [Acidiferrobacteraceae bacterium]|nr:glycosyltransferase family 9 protein [Acidiferrobacteraceae bacterium]
HAWLQGVLPRTLRPRVVVHPGASAPSRRYPLDHFSEVLRLLADADQFDVVLVGGAADTAALEYLSRLAPPTLTVLKPPDMGKLAALIESAAVLVANNSAPAHLAAATQTPVVDLYALTNPQHHPWRVPSRVLSADVPCRNCYRSVCPHAHHGCLRGVTPAAVAAAVHALLDSTPRQRASLGL